MPHAAKQSFTANTCNSATTSKSALPSVLQDDLHIGRHPCPACSMRLAIQPGQSFTMPQPFALRFHHRNSSRHTVLQPPHTQHTRPTTRADRHYNHLLNSAQSIRRDRQSRPVRCCLLPPRGEVRHTLPKAGRYRHRTKDFCSHSHACRSRSRVGLVLPRLEREHCSDSGPSSTSTYLLSC